MPLEAPDLSRYFTHGRTYRDIGTTIIGDPYDFQQTLTVESLGELPMPSGRFVVCDPSMVGDSDLPTLAEQVEPGSYPASAARLTTAYTSDPGLNWSEIAALRVEVRDTPVVAWEVAMLDGQDPDKQYGYPVDTGLACIVDAAANEAFGDGAWDRLAGACDDWKAVPAVVTDPVSGHAIAVTNSGAGDGMYPFWLGRDAEGKVVCVVTTFMHDIQ
ncbi:DUF4241 domain-containing protein [Kribbella soli]|uniref:DUF4241 domain-containing protein n=1 Tax=Kribbella soli TaxID=1124743 RepID=A0A4R0HJR2_9ACTN|nr:DUF4241 domain-containing protein [Kribbella soli]TCC10428.1 DUF4241 domain-containing protein [Kribbella soli]